MSDDDAAADPPADAGLTHLGKAAWHLRRAKRAAATRECVGLLAACETTIEQVQALQTGVAIDRAHRLANAEPETQDAPAPWEDGGNE